jgi:hypothetical protein
MMSISLQYGIPLEVIIRKFINTRFGPEGMTNDPQIPIATSIFDLICRKLALTYLNDEQLEELGVEDHEQKARQLVATELREQHTGETDGEKHEEEDKPAPEGWGWVTQRLTSGRSLKSLVNLEASCFSGRTGPSDFAEAREGASESGSVEQGGTEAGGEAREAEGQVPSQTS